MSERRRLISRPSRLGQLVVLSLLMACTLLVGVTAAEARVVVSPIARLTPGDQHAPDVEGTRVVYADNARGNDDIFLYDTTTKVRRRIQDSSYNDTNPKISGNNVIYLTTVGLQTQLMRYSISGNENFALNTGVSNVREAAVWGDRVAFIADGDAPYTWDVMTISISTGATETIGTYTRIPPFGIAIAGNYVAYSVDPDTTGDDDSGRMALYVADLATHTTKIVDFGSHAAVTASGTVIYSRSFGDDVTLPVAKYEANTDTSSTLFAGWAAPLDISGNRLLYFDRNGLWVRELTAGTLTKIASPKTLRTVWTSVTGTARMSGTRVVWDDSRYTAANGLVWPAGTPGNWMDYDVYAGTYGGAMMTVACPKGVTYGKHATISGKVTTTAGKVYTGKVTLQRSTDKVHWTSVTTKSTTTSGAYSLTSGAVWRQTYFRVRFVKGTLVDHSYYIKVMPRLILSKPTIVPLVVTTTKHVATLTGTARPAVTKASELYVTGGWQLADGTWREFDLSATPSTPVVHTGYSTYKIKLNGLVKAGKWRVRVHARNAAKGFDWGTSPYVYFTVK